MRPAPSPPRHAGGPRPAAAVIAIEGVLADFARQVAGDRGPVQSLIPAGVDPRDYEPTVNDKAAVARARLVISNGAGLERFMDALMSRAGENEPVEEASRGLEPLAAGGGGPEPHLWMDPVLAIRYVQNIRDALSRTDPPGEPTYGVNGDAYIHQLRDLDEWISDQVSAVAPERRVLVTDQEELEYFTDRYGIRLVEEDASSTPRVLTDLTGPSGPAPTYLEMMRYDVRLILASLGAGAS